MKKKIKGLIKNYIITYQKDEEIKSEWREPVVKFADADDPLFKELKNVVRPTHALPKEILKDAQTVIAYFIPFAKSIANSNIEGKYSSKKWARAYLETNQLISNLNNYLKKELANDNYQVSSIPATNNFDKKSLMSDWSHRHVAYVAGLGSFGINNMLITEKGCAGRVGTLITDVKIKPDQRDNKESCLNKAGMNCSKCIERCVNGALNIDSFNRFKCYDLLLENDSFHDDLALTDVCGKCNVDLPCSFNDPVS